REVRSVHEAVLERAHVLLAGLDGTRGDRVRLLRAAGSVELLASHAPDEALAALSTLGEPTDQPLDLAAVLAELARYATEDAGESGHSAIEVRLLTDLQRNTFAATAAGGETALPVQEALDQLRKLGVSVWVEDLGPAVAQPANLGVESIAPVGELLGPGLSS